MEAIKSQLKEAAQVILNDIDKDSKAAQQRVRKATLVIAKSGKDYRRATLAKGE